MYALSKRSVGSSLRKLREEAGLTQVQVARRLLMPQSFVSKVETGERGLQVGELFSYAEALGVSAEYALRKVSEGLDQRGQETQRQLSERDR